MIENPRLRVFHVDTECYVVYVGKNPNDYRPFLRVGNSHFLPERAKAFISAVIITDSLTGNQLIEHENLEIPLNGETRYIGDPEEVAKLKQFLEDNDIPSEPYDEEDDDDAPPEKSGAFVYFFKNGNIQLYRDKERLFDLQEQERADNHFVYRVEKTVQAVKSNPFRYQPSDLSPPGFFFSGEAPYFFRDGKIGAIGVCADYFRDLGCYGLDPDYLSWLVEDRISEGVLCRFKRAAVTRKDIRVATLDLKKFQDAVSLFSSSGLSCIVVHLEAGEEKVFSGFTLRRRGGDLSLFFPASAAFPEILFPEDAAVSTGRIFMEALAKTGIAGGAFGPVEGVPYRVFERMEAEAGTLAKTYLLDVASELKNIGEGQNLEILKSLETLSQAFTASSGSAAAKSLSGKKYKNSGEGAPEEISYLLWNIHEFARMCASRKGLPEGIVKNSSRVASLVVNPSMPGKNHTRLPVLGDMCRIDGVWYVFYRWNGVLTKLKLLQAQKNCESIEKLTVRDNEAFYVSERKRLIDFIGGLLEAPRKKRPAPLRPGDPGGTAAAAASSASSGKAAPAAAKTGTAESFPAKTPAALQEAVSPAAVPETTRSLIAKGRLGKILLPALLVVALGGGVFLLVRTCSGGTPDAAGMQQESPARPEQAAQPAAPTPPESPARTGPAAEPAGTAAGAGIELASIRITVLDIYYCVNEIAMKNGYSTLDGQGTQKPDPNRIYPGRVLVLPNAANYVIDLRDTMWGIATRYIRGNIRELGEAYGILMRPYGQGGVSADKKEEVAGELRKLIGKCKSENLRRIFEEKIRNL
ncbi:MAG: hypothetical protein LBT33_05390 [Spirochaetia bacterium]|jgi:hypothetical protein|nr:hypothetical protein [Spirochaetia bacterium]